LVLSSVLAPANVVVTPSCYLAAARISGQPAAVTVSLMASRKRAP
jgi:hypothetical protein